MIVGLRNWLYRMLDRGHAPERDPESLIEIGRVLSIQVPMALAYLERNGYAAVAQRETLHNQLDLLDHSWILIQARWAPEAAEVLHQFIRELA